tara:strand:+ start:161 stop:424 length:264 start_codon:yes stop_codon:yes gene_type:complete
MNDTEKLAIYILSGFSFILSIGIVSYACLKTKNIEEIEEENVEVRNIFQERYRNAIYIEEDEPNYLYPEIQNNFITFNLDGISETDV